MIYNSDISKKELDDLILKWSIKTFGPTFKFRPKQKETISDIIYNWLHGTSDIILDAPTGSGKSIVAIIIGGVLSEYFGKTGYILISDLSLLDQYRADIEMYLPNWAVLRGQQTYTCIVNGLNFNVGVCKLKGATSYSDIKGKFPDCAPFCEYIVERERAMTAPVTICTYSFWLMQQNYVKSKFHMQDMPAPFDTRDFVICDEAHKLVSIVQNHFSPKFGKNDIEKFESVIDEGITFAKDKDSFKQEIKDLRKSIENIDDKSQIKLLLEKYLDKIKELVKISNKLKTDIGAAAADSENGRLSKSERTLIYTCDFISDHCVKFEDYCSIIDKVGPDFIVKNDSSIDNTITFNCLNESYLLNRTFHSNCGKKLYMSATIGDPDTFAKENSFSFFKSIKLPVVFDYTNSPIFYVPDYKMSYKEKDTSLPNVIRMIENIMKMYPDKRGIIQTGSYSFAKQLFEKISKNYKNRLLLYEDSVSKQENLNTYRYSENMVLVGPSLVEGLSLNDDLCRFQIIMKIPYPSLADKFISAKQQFNPTWYSETTAISMLQGVGRGVRNEKDWCVTFILDGCFNNLLNSVRNMFPKEFIDRIQVIPSSSLLF